MACAGAPAADADAPIRLIVPFRAGGSTDVVARVVSHRLGILWKQPVNVENHPGGYGTLGAHLGNSQDTAGRTLVFANIALALNEVYTRQTPTYSAKRDLVPVALIARQPTGLVVQPQYPADTLAEFLEGARNRGGPVLYASSGTGSVGHLAGELLRYMTGLPLVHTPQPRAGHTLGQAGLGPVPCAFAGLPATLHHVKVGKLRLIAVTDTDRAPAAKEVPTIGELVPGFAVNNWVGIVAPYGVSVRHVRRINADINRVVRSAEVREPLEGLGFDVWTATPGFFKEMLDANIEQFGRLVQQAGIKMERGAVEAQ